MGSKDDQLVLVKERLYVTVNGDRGLRVIVHGPGARIPRAEYERLKASNPGAKAEVLKSEPEPEALADAALDTLSRAQLLVRCAKVGVNPPARAKTADLIASIEKAEADQEAGGSDEDTSTETTEGDEDTSTETTEG